MFFRCNNQRPQILRFNLQLLLLIMLHVNMRFFRSFFFFFFLLCFSHIETICVVCSYKTMVRPLPSGHGCR